MSYSNEDREFLRDSIVRMLEQNWPASRASDLLTDDTAHRDMVQRVAEQGLLALGFGEESGGLKEVVMSQVEFGAAACPTVLASAAIANLTLGADESLGPLIESIHAGEAVLAIAAEPLDSGSGGCSIANGFIDGAAIHVEHAELATHFLVEADDAVAIVEKSERVAIESMPGYDEPSLSMVRFEEAAVTSISLEPEAVVDISRLYRLMLVARAYGAARRGFELVIEHVKTRKQFGVAIGTFQAIQHKLANCLICLDAVQLNLDYSAEQYDLGNDTWRACSAVTFTIASEYLRQTALEIHHSFGAIGFSEEHEMPRHFRRIHADMARLGGTRASREEVAAFVLDGDISSLPQFDMGEAANGFREEVQAFLAGHWGEEQRAADRLKPQAERDFDKSFTRKLYEKGWTNLSWPKAFGGQERSLSEQYVFIEEMMKSGAPDKAHSCGTELIAPAIMAYGSDWQKEEWLPKIASGEISLCLGYSEPEAGSDLASLRTRAVRDGEDWVITGQKLWTTLGDKASHVWLAVRTDPEAKKHAGISVFMVPLDTPGIDINPEMAMYGHTFCTVFYEEVRVPEKYLVGGLNKGWEVITSALASERLLMGGRVAMTHGMLADFIDYLKEPGANGASRTADPVLRHEIGKIVAEMEAARHLALRTIRVAESGRVPIHEAAIGKVYYGEFQQRALETLIGTLGSQVTLSEDAAEAPIHGRLEQSLRESIMNVVGGGAAEIQRNIIAQVGLGLPRA